MSPPILDGTADFYGEEPERRDWFQIVGWSFVAIGFIYYAWRAFA